MESVLLPAQAAGGQALARLKQDLLGVHWDILDRQRTALAADDHHSPASFEPPPLVSASTSESPDVQEAFECGWEALRQGRVALCTVAGGQASRLGFDGPKGTFPLGPVSGASLFHMFAGQVARLRALTGASLPWIIQTGPGNHDETRTYFKKRSFFGLPSSSVQFVCQGTLPALTAGGQFLLAQPDALFRNPNGHGGFFRAMQRTHTLAALRDSGVDLLFYCQVDNPLIRMGDPAFLGFHLLAQSNMSVKVLEKQSPEEKVGLVVLSNGRTVCVEYSDLAPELASRRAEDGGLLYRAGNLAVHVFDLDFAQTMATTDLPLHMAHKNVQALADGLTAQRRPGVKFETFVFDALPFADKTVVQLCLREEEFAPVKNRFGLDSIATARRAMTVRARRWLETASPNFCLPTSGSIEIAPGVALDSRDLQSQCDRLRISTSGHLVTVSP